MKNFILLVVVTFLVSCAHKTKILDAPAVSMSRDALEKGEKFQHLGPVSAEYCMDSFNDKGSIGLMDQVIQKAQDEHKVDYILNASFWSSAGCISVEGQGAKIVSGKE